MIRDRLVYKTALSLVTIATSGLVRLVFSVLVGHLFGAALLGHVNVIVSTAVFATLLCSPGLGQSVARQLATRALAPGDPAGRSLLRGATAAHHALCLVVSVVAGLLVPAAAWQQHLLAIALTFGYGCYTYYKAVLYGADLVRPYAVLELSWDVLFLAALVTVAVTGATAWVLAPMVLVYLGFSAGAHRILFRSRRAPGTASAAVMSPGGTVSSAAATTVPAVKTSATTTSATTVSSAPTSGTPDAPAARPAVGPAAPAVASPAPAAAPPAPPAPARWWRAVTAYAAVITVGTASSAGFLQLSQLFAARADAGHGSGLFAAAMTLVTPAYLLPRAISVVLFPAMARAAGRADAERVRTQLTVGTQVLAAVLLPGFVLAACLSTTLVTAFYGSDFADGGAIFAVMAWATWVSVASVPAVNALSSDTGRGYLIPSGASVLGFLVGLVIWLAAGTSIVLVAWGYLIGSVVQSAIPVLAAARRHGGPGWWLGARVLAVATGGLLVALLVTRSAALVQLAVGVGAALVAVVVVLPECRSLMRLRARRAGA